MKLHDNQLKLIRLLILFNCLDYPSCLKVLDRDNTGDTVALSYQFRPLTKHKYLGKNEEGIVTVLKKGRALFPELKPLVAIAGLKKGRERVMQVCRIAAMMDKIGVAISAEAPEDDTPCFIPSACWKKIAPGILSTTRFVGMLLIYGMKYAVYDIGDGSMEWQLRAEASLFYRKYGSFETKADGMIFICQDGMWEQIAKQIIRQTMWNRRTLLQDRYAETDKPQRYSRSPIKLRTQYEHVYLTTSAKLLVTLERICDELDQIEEYSEKWSESQGPKWGDVENYPDRYFLNPAYDILKIVYFFNAAKAQLEAMDSSLYQGPMVNYIMVMHREDLPILQMYPDLMKLEGVEKRAYRLTENP